MLMIDGKKGSVSIVGTTEDLLAEMTTLIHTMFERFCEASGGDREEVKELFEMCFEHSFKTMEELNGEYTNEVWKRMVGDDFG